MTITECLHTACDCYRSGRSPMTPVGIIVHSTGVNNPALKRYVQPSEDDEKKEELLSLLGVNAYGNHWNRPGIKKSMHYFIGKTEGGEVATVRILPESIAAWGVGKGKKGSYNYDPTGHIQFEVCEDALTDRSYFTACYEQAAALCADICARYGWDASVVLSHKEAAARGYASSHGDIDHWLKKFGLRMDDFRDAVNALLAPKAPTVWEPKVGELVFFRGRTHYSNANKLLPALCRPGKARITRIYGVGKCRHPYHLVATKGGGSSVYGWVDEGSFTLATEEAGG